MNLQSRLCERSQSKSALVDGSDEEIIKTFINRRVGWIYGELHNVTLDFNCLFDRKNNPFEFNGDTTR